MSQHEELKGSGLESPVVEQGRFAPEGAPLATPADADTAALVQSIPLTAEAAQARGDGPNGELVNGVDYVTCWHFYRCMQCRTLLTRDDELKAYKTGVVCQCGSSRYHPCMPNAAERNSATVLTYMAKYGFDSFPSDEPEALDEVLADAPDDKAADNV